MVGAVKDGSEFLVNTTTEGIQQQAFTTTLAGGKFLVMWGTQRINPDKSSDHYDLRGRIFKSDGTPLANDFVIVDDKEFSFGGVAAPQGTGFVAVWNAPFDGSSSSFVWREVDDDGSTLGGIVEISEATNDLHRVETAASTLGGHLVAWTDSAQSKSDTTDRAILASANGGAPFTVNAATDGDEGAPAVAGLLNGSGNYVAVWTRVPPVGDRDARGQILAADGSKIGGEFLIDTKVSVGEDNEVTALADGSGFVVSWADGFGIRGRVFSNSGVALSDDFQINLDDVGAIRPAIASLSNGLIAASWQKFNNPETMSARTFAPDGTPIGDLVTFDNTDATPTQGGNFIGDASITALSGGDFVLAWTDGGGDHGGDASLSSIVGQLYSSTAPAFIKGTKDNDSLNGATQTGMFLGFAGSDTVSYASAGTGLTASLSNPAANTGAAAGDTYGISIENLTGSNFVDTMTGNAGANTLDGGGGKDTLTGLAGDDRYVVDQAGDVIVETVGNGAADRVLARASFALAADDDIEILTTSSGTATTAINLTGNALAQEIVGNYGVNVLNSGGIGGVDLLRGLSGNDTYRIHNSADAIQEGNGQGTADKVVSSVNYTLGAGVQVEFLQTSSGAGKGALNLTGNELAQEIVGNAGANRLEGKGGADTLRGSSGADTFVFASKLGGGNIDTITDFSAPADRFLLSDAIFTALTPGTIAAAQFRANTTGLAQDSTDRIIYDTDGGEVFYDADGLGGAAGTQFATVGTGLSITNADFAVA